MKKVIGIASGLISPFFLTSLAFADDVSVNPCANQNAQFNKLCLLSTEKFGGVVGTVINFIFVLATIIALFYLIYGGLKWILSEGDKSAVETARSHIVASIVGLIVIFLAYFIINVLLGFFVGQSIQTLTLPKLP